MYMESHESRLDCLSYGSYHDREVFWEHIDNYEVLKGDNIILGGILNLTVSSTKIWGSHHVDPLVEYFNQLFKESSLTDICLVPISPTRRNKIKEEQGVVKRLDCFLILDRLVDRMG